MRGEVPDIYCIEFRDLDIPDIIESPKDEIVNVTNMVGALESEVAQPQHRLGRLTVESSIISDLEVEEAAEFIFDGLDNDSSIDVKVVAEEHFGSNELNDDQSAIVEAALGQLKDAFDMDFRITEDGKITVLEEIPEKQIANRRGRFVKLQPGAIVYENEKVPISQLQECIITGLSSVLRTGVPTSLQKGATRQYLKNFVAEHGFKTDDFEQEFTQLRRLLDKKIERNQQGGKTRYVIKRNLAA